MQKLTLSTMLRWFRYESLVNADCCGLVMDLVRVITIHLFIHSSGRTDVLMIDSSLAQTLLTLKVLR